jgi:MoxR-like ATPase
MSDPLKAASVFQLRIELAAPFPERKEVVDGALAAVLAGEHVFCWAGPTST